MIAIPPSPLTTWYATTLSSSCACNTTACPHYAQANVLIVSTVEEPPPPRPRPWLRERVPVVPVARHLALPPWRPRQQRARDGI